MTDLNEYLLIEQSEALKAQIAALTAERDSLRAQISDLAALNAALISFVNGQITRAELDNQINSTTTGEHE